MILFQSPFLFLQQLYLLSGKGQSVFDSTEFCLCSVLVVFSSTLGNPNSRRLDLKVLDLDGEIDRCGSHIKVKGESLSHFSFFSLVFPLLHERRGYIVVCCYLNEGGCIEELFFRNMYIYYFWI